MNKNGADASDFLPWYREGLRFECTGCGGCCTGSEGYVWVSDDEIAGIAKDLGLEIDDFGKRYLRRVGNSKYALLEDRSTGDCVFLFGRRCMIYDVRPKQCRTFPFWAENLKSKKNWEAAAEECEGISEDAPLHTFEEIERNLD